MIIQSTFDGSVLVAKKSRKSFRILPSRSSCADSQQKSWASSALLSGVHYFSAEGKVLQWMLWWLVGEIPQHFCLQVWIKRCLFYINSLNESISCGTLCGSRTKILSEFFKKVTLVKSLKSWFWRKSIMQLGKLRVPLCNCPGFPAAIIESPHCGAVLWSSSNHSSPPLLRSLRLR